jgi:hypothetical protein
MGNTAQSNGSSHAVEVTPIVLLRPQYKNVFLYHLFFSFSSIYRRIHIKQEIRVIYFLAIRDTN